jgi:N-acetylmuramoyl-L-alanine amidase
VQWTARRKGFAAAGSLAVVAASLFVVPILAQATQSVQEDSVERHQGPVSLQDGFREASREFHVPVQILLGVSYQESRWDGHRGRFNTGGGYGPMDLTDVTPAMTAAGRHAGMTGADAAALAASPAMHTLGTAARLTGTPAARLRSQDLQNIRGGAALLAWYERAGTGRTPADPADWYGAVARYSRSTDQADARRFADEVFGVLTAGAARTMPDGQRVRLAPEPALRPDRRAVPALKAAEPAASQAAECPAGVRCAFVQAAREGFQKANRPFDGLDIRYIVIHDTEGSYQGAITSFQDASDATSATYVMRSSDGAVTQMVPNEDVAFHAGNYWFNMHSVGIEHEGFAAAGASWYTEAQYRSTARLVRYLAARYGIPLDRRHIIGHDDVPGPQSGSAAGMHWDPGPYWDWAHFMDLLGAPVARGGRGVPAVGSAVTITPAFAGNRQPVRVCGTPAGDADPDAAPPEDSGTGCTSGTRPANFLYVRTAAGPHAPLFTDPAIHGHGGTGTDRIDDWGDTVSAGQQFVVAGRSGDWTAIWFSGAKVWFFNPKGANTTAAGGATVVSATPAAAPAAVYGQGYPRRDEYPPGLRPSPQAPLSMYRVPAGQSYVATASPERADDFFADDPSDTVVTGAARYYTVQFGHRLALLDAADLAVRTG